MILSVWLLFALVGVVAGLVAGLFGLGGGVVMVPALIYSFTLLGYDEAVLTHLAVGTSLACIVITSCIATRTHQQKGAVDWALLKRWVPGILLGAWLGGVFAAQLAGPVLQMAFGIFLLLVGVTMLVSLMQDRDAAGHHGRRPSQHGDRRDFIALWYRWRLSDCALPTLLPRAYAASGGNVCCARVAFGAGGQPVIYVARLGPDGAARGQQWLYLLAGFFRPSALQRPRCTLRCQVGAPFTGPKAAERLCAGIAARRWAAVLFSAASGLAPSSAL